MPVVLKVPRSNTVLPVFVNFTVFAVLNRAYSAPYGTIPGEVVLALVTGLYAAGLGWLYRLGGMPTPGRFLGPDSRRPADRPTAVGSRR